MDWVSLGKAVLMGIVEGATEFIPVSSTGHLILAGDWLNFQADPANTFEVVIQLGAILAVLWIYRERLASIARRWRTDPTARRFILNVMIAFVPAAGVGFLIHDWMKETLFKPIVVAWALVLGGIVILLIEKWNPKVKVETVDEMPMVTALNVGIAQILALIPGVSRSGATIMGGRAVGMSRKAATEFSFFLAIPIMFMASFYDLFKARDTLSTSHVPVFAVGFVVSFLSAIVVVRAFLGFVSKHTFVPFAWYRIVFGVLLLLVYGLI